MLRVTALPSIRFKSVHDDHAVDEPNESDLWGTADDLGLATRLNEALEPAETEPDIWDDLGLADRLHEALGGIAKALPILRVKEKTPYRYQRARNKQTGFLDTHA